MRKVVYLHVGTHKTGTTSIQYYCANKKFYLGDNGLKFIEVELTDPKTGNIESNPNSFLLAHYFLRDDLVTVMRSVAIDIETFESKCFETAKSVQEIIENTPHRRLLISSEAFCFARTDAERSAISGFFERLDCEVRPIIVLRSQAQWRESFKAELAKTKYSIRNSGLPDCNRVDSDWYFDRKAVVSFWSSFGSPIVLNYEEAMVSYGSIIPSLLKAVGIEVAPDSESYFLNRRQTGR
ncbi:hypothetical protein E2F50_01055 [Rhizobium deserti]|uniref:Sulfotransferase family protein n=1 Tax=Rhizobium deserti TaxID=2547961 RepID=A0A4R5ULR1_9HYPH|nr:hypothetical protein [Rhizobium deserti]TDK38772.1 hypothetical protein E2F50_01055 [Rhizobium deserti]